MTRTLGRLAAMAATGALTAAVFLLPAHATRDNRHVAWLPEQVLSSGPGTAVSR
jgi:hypothetical protein